MKPEQFLISFICIVVSISVYGQRPANMAILFSKLNHYDSLPVKNYEADSVATGVLSALSFEYKNFIVDSAVYYGNKALQLSQKINFKRGIATAYNQLALIYMQKGEFITSLDYNYRALEIWKSFQKENPSYYNSTIIISEARQLSNMGNIYSQRFGYDDRALDMYLQALKIDESKGNKLGIANKSGNIAIVFMHQKNYAKSIEYYARALTIFKELNEKARVAECYQNLGQMYNQKGDTNLAKEYCLQAISINKTEGNKQLLSEEYNNLGRIYDDEKKYDTAANYYFAALDLKKETGDNPGISIALGNIGSMYLDMKMYTESENYLSQAIAISDTAGDVQTQHDQHVNVSELYAKTGQYQKALENYQKATALNDSLFNEQKANDITRKEMNYEFDKKEAIANAAYEKQLALTEADKKIAIAEADKKRVVAEAEKKIAVTEAENKRIAAEADKKQSIAAADKKIAVSEADKKRTVAEAGKKLALTNAALEKQKLIRNSMLAGMCGIGLLLFLGFINFRNKRKREKAELSQQVAETEMKALRSQMNPHFLFNALSSIQSFLLNNQSSDANIYLLKFKELIRLVLENSMYREVALAEDMKALELYMQLERIRSLQPFSYHINIDKKLNPEQTAIPPLILQPFVENAIWHGLQPRTKAGGHIEISVSKKDNHLNCIVEDNGVGRTADAYMQKISPFKKESLGIKLTEERLKIINELRKAKAHFNITDLFSPEHEPCGTRVELTLPLSV